MKSNLFFIFLIFAQTIDAVSEDGVKDKMVVAKTVLQGSVPPSCVGRCGGCTPCERVAEEAAPGDFIWKCVCKRLNLQNYDMEIDVLVFFDLNLSPLIKEAWEKVDITEVTMQEFDFLLGE
ncbi:uncharacterized protein LOC131017614 [Salvia miltiorrhiza]|uniref:uncharacterized protein LOC131017614 n=1 Tax=Salvia miltiorrhiza TaxID=226208 RepID=UPI0025ABDB51|nr:uncharacterized protein LOC131017614 [Salvia miltiorrhiza]